VKEEVAPVSGARVSAGTLASDWDSVQSSGALFPGVRYERRKKTEEKFHPQLTTFIYEREEGSIVKGRQEPRECLCPVGRNGIQAIQQGR